MATCPAGCELHRFEQAVGAAGKSSGYCTVTGAHLEHRMVLGCERHNYWHSLDGEVTGRYCPCDCDWASPEESEEECE